MRPVDSRHPAGVVGYPSAGTARYLEFFDALEATQVPRGTGLYRAFSCDVVDNCNQLVRMADEDHAAWLWLQGDDHVWAPDLLLKLLDHDVDIVVPLTPRRTAPFTTVVYKQFSPADSSRTQTYSWQDLQLHRYLGETLVDCVACGSGGMLIRRHVWDALRADGGPVFRRGPGAHVAEDLDLTHRAHNLGFRVCADVTAFMGHCTTGVLQPYAAPDGRLGIGVGVGGKVVGIFETSQPQEIKV